MDELLMAHYNSVLEFFKHKNYEIEIQEVEKMLNPVTKRESEILDEYASLMEEFNALEDDQDYLRQQYYGTFETEDE